MASFECCKSKSFIHFVCIDCSSVFHKCCLPRFKNQIRFVKDNQIICCKDLINSDCSDEDSDKSILEKTISELVEDSDLKSKYIEKLKLDKNAFMQDAMKTEEELSDLMKKQQKIIDDLEEQIEFLNKNAKVKINIQTSNKETQTGFCTRNASTSTNFEQLTSGVSVSYVKATSEPINNNSNHTLVTPTSLSEVDVSKQLQYNEPGIEGSTNNSIGNNSTPINHSTLNKRQILLLTDDTEVSSQLKRCLDKNIYEIFSVKKPGALLHQVIENMETLASCIAHFQALLQRIRNGAVVSSLSKNGHKRSKCSTVSCTSQVSHIGGLEPTEGS
ncbi:hypothetical protein JTB14_007378 [Gonioctena quinquepunctata]|nr:hypothetical protein JTB14_007378 [Gonioctena quinquepunctata]